MISLVYLALALGFGFAFTRWLGLSLTRIETCSMSIVTGLFGFTWMMFLPCLVLPYAIALPLGIMALIAAGTYLWLSARPATERRLPFAASITWYIIAAATAVFWCCLMVGHDLPNINGSLMAAGSTWADFGLHASIVSHQAVASKLPMDLPIASGTPLTYPFLIDFLSALFLRSGWNLNFALAVPGTLLAWSITQLLISFGWRLWGKFGGAVLGTFLFLTGGAAVGLTVAWHDWHTSGLSLLTWLGHLPQNYSGIDAYNAHFNNAVADILLPQRAFLFGMGIWLVIAILWHAALTHHRPRLIMAGAVLMGLMPMAHPHSFVAAGVLFAGLFVYVWRYRRTELRWWFLAAGVIAAIALPQLLWQQLATGTGTGGHLVSGWERQPTESLISYEWHNFGVVLFVLAGLTIALWRRSWRPYTPWLAPFLILFVAAQMYSLQPFAYDNLKLLLYVYLMAMLALGAAIWNTGKYTRAVLTIVAIATISIPGTLTIVREFQLHDQFASNDDLALATWIQTNTKPSDVFATTDSPNQPIATVAGRSIVLGYRGWLYNYHLDYSGRAAAITALLAGNVSDPSIAAYHPQYLAVRIYEPSDWTVDQAALAKLPVVFQNTTWTLYRLPN